MKYICIYFRGFIKVVKSVIKIRYTYRNRGPSIYEAKNFDYNV